jgi:DDB1- and CUL4-associated factor 13
VGNLAGHSDGISVFSKSSKHVSNVVSGSWDGELRFWDLVSKQCLFSTFAHEKFVKGLCFDHSGNFIYSCGNDNEINVYHVNKAIACGLNKKQVVPQVKLVSKSILQSLDASHANSTFVTGGAVVQLWSQERSNPIQTWSWGVDTVSKVRFNPVETNLIACTAMDRGIYLYDVRGKTPLQKTVLLNKSSALCWNPQEPFNFTVGNEDGNAYSFDMRKLDQIKLIHQDHIGAMYPRLTSVDLDYAPTGKQFVTASFDKTIRVFNHDSGKSLHCIHTKRMQKYASLTQGRKCLLDDRKQLHPQR